MSLENHPRLNSALQSFTSEYVLNPFRYLYEVDTQVLLSKHLEKEFMEPHIIKAQQEQNKDRKFDIGKVHREYPNSIKPDNVVLGEPRYFTQEQLKVNTKMENFYDQPIQYAIELKFVPLNLETNSLDVALGDYKRFIDDKLPTLKNWFDFKYGLQLTLFQSSHEHDFHFINYLTDQRWQEYYSEQREKYFEPNKDTFGFYFINLNTNEIEPIWS